MPKPLRSFERAASANESRKLTLKVRREWTIASDIQHIEPLVSEVVAISLDAGLSARACRLNVPVALTEALSNAIVCGNREDVKRHVKVTLLLDAQALTLEITDDGEGFDPTSVTFSPDDGDWLEREDGRGLFLMRSLMDRVELRRPSAGRPGHTVRLVLNRA